MEETILQRIRAILDDKSISVNALAKQIKVAQATLNPQLRGDRALSSHIVELILNEFPDVSAEWIMRGKGSMYTEDSYRNAPIPLAVSTPDVATDPVQAKESDGIWKAKYEAIKECYDSLLASLGGVIGKRNVG